MNLLIWDDQPTRLLELEDQVEERLGFVTLEGEWLLSSLAFVGKKRTRDPAGVHSCAISMRARLYARQGGPTP